METALLRKPVPGPDRLRLALLKVTGRLPRKGQRLEFVNVGAARLKRIVLRDTFLAAEMERVYEAFGPTPHLPTLAQRHENEVWALFVPGTDLPRGGPDMLAGLATFFATVYGRGARRLPLHDTPFAHRLARDLHVLRVTGVLDAARHAALQAAAERLAPTHVWVGFDYTDAVHKNFVVRADDGLVCGIDVESLRDGQLLGVGIVKAALRWLGEAPALLDALAARGAPDLRADYDYIALSFIARWTRTKLMTGKTHFVDAGRFERFVRAP